MLKIQSTTMGDEARKLFGTDGIRGIANQEPMTAEMALRLGQAVAQKFQAKGRHGRIVIGKDTRLSGYMLESALQAGIVSAGADVMLVGPLPTPGIAFITSSMRADAGVVISASHNPFQDNGIKLFAADGFKLPDETEVEIEQRMEAIARGAGRRAGGARSDRQGGAHRRRRRALRAVPQARLPQGAHPRRHQGGRRLRATGRPIRSRPQVFQELGAEVDELNVWPDGRNINYHCGALHPENMAEQVRRSGAHLGVALDGDADRVILADEKGNIIDGDQLMAILGHPVARPGAPAEADGGRDGHVQPGARTGAVGQGRQARAHRGRRPVRRRSDARSGGCCSAASSPGTSSSSTTPRPATAWWRRCACWR